MILIADSGSTKCDWICLDSEYNPAFKTITMGFNPYFHSQATISTAIKQNPELHAQSENVTHIYYYGAGCSSPTLNKIVSQALKVSFPNAKTVVDHDLLGAAYAAYTGTPNITCILGTGSNSCFFDGEHISERVPALGFILGDEGSGSYFGKKLIAGFMYGQLPDEANAAFKETYDLDMSEIVSNVYTKPHANVYLASFVRFISNYKTHPYFQNMLHNGMKEF
jgi:N-acetylglucosamine kinase-like BadF-type ATPase